MHRNRQWLLRVIDVLGGCAVATCLFTFVWLTLIRNDQTEVDIRVLTQRIHRIQIDSRTLWVEAQRQRELDNARRLAETERARAEEQAHASRRLRQRAVLLTVALAASAVLATAALVFWRRAIQANHLATSRELAAAAINNLEVDPERSVLLALHGLEEANTLEARNALHRAVPEAADQF